MSQINRPLVCPDDEVDGLLRAFFRAQLPEPWPEMKAPEGPFSSLIADPLASSAGSDVERVGGVLPLAGLARATLAATPEGSPRWPLFRSRLALAASVALLVGGSLMLPGISTEGPTHEGPLSPGGPPTAHRVVPGSHTAPTPSPGTEGNHPDDAPRHPGNTPLEPRP
jgi:hypothetical protein